MKVPLLKRGDKIALVAPAKSIEKQDVLFAKEYFESQGFEVVIGSSCLGRHHYFSGTIKDRLADFQWALDAPEIKAIICARGGYGCVQLVDLIDWNTFKKHPKWIVGFSDITVFHQRIQKMGLPSIHGTMPLNFSQNSKRSLTTLIDAVSNTPKPIEWKSSSGVHGESSGVLVGGNLSILFSLLGTNDQIDYNGKILFIEDLCEQLYHLDRMFYAFKKAGVLHQLKGMVVGGMSDMKDTEVPFGKNYQEIILSHTKMLGIPVAFDFPAGHQNDNCALVFGKEVSFKSGKKSIITL